MTCPICGRASDPNPRLRPFCTRRCADVDLGRWLTEQYAVPSTAPDAAEPADHDPA